MIWSNPAKAKMEKGSVLGIVDSPPGILRLGLGRAALAQTRNATRDPSPELRAVGSSDLLQESSRRVGLSLSRAVHREVGAGTTRAAMPASKKGSVLDIVDSPPGILRLGLGRAGLAQTRNATRDPSPELRAVGSSDLLQKSSRRVGLSLSRAVHREVGAGTTRAATPASGRRNPGVLPMPSPPKLRHDVVG